MAKITTIQTSGKEVSLAGKKNKKIDPKDFPKIRAQLRPGETLRKDGTLMYRPTKQDYEPDGVQPTKPIYANSIEELRQKEINYLIELKQRAEINSGKATLHDVYLMWKELKRGVRNSTMANYNSIYELFIQPSIISKMYISKIKKSDLRAFYNNLMDARALSIHTIEGVSGVMTMLFKYAEEDRLISYNPAIGALSELRQSCSMTVEEKDALTVPEQQVFLEYLDKPQNGKWKPLLLTLLGTGMRISELCALRWEDCDFENREIHINYNLVYYQRVGEDRKCVFDVHSPKTKAGRRVIPMLNFVYDTLLAEKKRQDEAGSHSDYQIHGLTGLIFTNRFGEAYKHGTVNSALHRIQTKYNESVLDKGNRKNAVLLPMFTCHTLRHTFCTRAYENGVDILALSKVMGHRNTAVTLQIYTTCTESFKKRAFGINYPDKYHDIFADAFKDLGIASVK